MNYGKPSFDSISRALAAFDKENLELWSLTVVDQNTTNMGKSCEFASYFEDIKGFPSNPKYLDLDPENYILPFTSLCFDQDANVGVDITIGNIDSKLGPDSIPDGQYERPKLEEKKPSDKSKKKKRHDKSKHSGIAKSKSYAVMSNI